MAQGSKNGFELQKIGLGTDIEKYTSHSSHQKTQTELQVTSHLEEILKKEVDSPVLTQELQKDSRPAITYGHSILSAVVYEKYDTALAELDMIMGLKLDYPVFGEKAGRYIQHAKSLVKAIKSKRAIGRLPHISRAKQKDLMASLGHHFNELKSCIVNIEKVERYARKEDISSTRWMVLTAYWCLFAVFSFALFINNFPDVFVGLHQEVTMAIYQTIRVIVRFIWPL